MSGNNINNNSTSNYSNNNNNNNNSNNNNLNSYSINNAGGNFGTLGNSQIKSSVMRVSQNSNRIIIDSPKKTFQIASMIP